MRFCQGVLRIFFAISAKSAIFYRKIHKNFSFSSAKTLPPLLSLIRTIDIVREKCYYNNVRFFQKVRDRGT